MDDQRRHDQGMSVRRAVLGDPHVDRATAATTELFANQGWPAGEALLQRSLEPRGPELLLEAPGC